MKLSQGDSVIITAGKDKGKRGIIMRVLKEQNRVIVSGANMMTKHVKKTAQGPGKKLTLERSLAASNVMIVDPKSGKPTRIGYQIDPVTGMKSRIAKRSKTVIGRVKAAQSVPAKTEAKSKDKPAAKPEETTPGKKSPFWKKIGFGADAMAADESGSGKAGTGPTQSTPGHTRSAGRGS